jgi:hypothetical protein
MNANNDNYVPPNLNTPGFISTTTGHVMLEVLLVVNCGWKRIARGQSEPEQDCSICRVQLCKTNCLQPMCGHTFHDMCILKIVASVDRTKAVCPLCRAPLTTSVPKPLPRPQKEQNPETEKP